MICETGLFDREQRFLRWLLGGKIGISRIEAGSATGGSPGAKGIYPVFGFAGEARDLPVPGWVPAPKDPSEGVLNIAIDRPQDVAPGDRVSEV